MHPDMETWTEQFDQSLLVLMQNLGPQLIHRAQLGLTPGQVFMLHFIQKEEQCRVSKLAEMMEVAPSAITVMLDRLEAHDYVTRARDHEDRRVVLVHLTEAGEKKLNQVLAVRKQIMQQCLNQVDPEELAVFLATLEKIAIASQQVDLQSTIETSCEGTSK